MVRHHHITYKLCDMQAITSLKWHLKVTLAAYEVFGLESPGNPWWAKAFARGAYVAWTMILLWFCVIEYLYQYFTCQLVTAGCCDIAVCQTTTTAAHMWHSPCHPGCWLWLCPLTGLVRWHYCVWNNDCRTQSRNPCVCDRWHRRCPSGRREQ